MNRAARLRDWQRFTVELMVVGYAGYYLCRSNLSVSLLVIAEDLTAAGARAQRIGSQRTIGMGRLAGNDRLRAGQVRRGEPGRPPGRAAELPDRHGRRGRLHDASSRWGARCRSSRWSGSPTG